MAFAAGPARPDPEELADAVLAASRVLVQMSVQWLDSVEPDINLTEFRALAVLTQQGPQRLIDLAASLGVTSTTATRLADHLAARGLVNRVRQSRDRREIHLSISSAGDTLVTTVRRSRQRFLASILEGFTGRDQETALRILGRFAEAVVPDEKESA